jgi:hypothetical protein
LQVGGEARQVELQPDDSLILTGKAEDRGGIKDMVLQGNALVTCADPSTGAPYTRSTGFLRRHVPGSASGDLASPRRDSRFVLRAGDFERLCPEGRLEGAVGQARVQAANYHGGASTTPHLEFRIAVSEVAAQAIGMPSAMGSARPAGPTGFAPEGSAGGTGAPVGAALDAGPAAAGRTEAAFVPRMCSRSERPGHGAEARPAGAEPECLDAPVPSMSPPAPAAGPAAAPAPRPGPARVRDRRTSRIGAQKAQIRTHRATGI